MPSVLTGRRPGGVVLQAGSILIAGIGTAWTYYGMRAVMDVGGSCADGGPYVSVQPCPDGSWMMAVGIPVMVITTILGTAVAASSSTPPPVLWMWGALFTSLGANFLEYGFGDPVSVSWIVCGVVFELMAAPAWLFILLSLRTSRTDQPGQANLRVYWTALYLGLGALGWALGWWSYDAWS